MQFVRSHSPYMSFSKLADHIHPLQSRLRAYHKYPPSISACLSVNGSFGTKPTSEISPRYSQNSIITLQSNQKYSTSVLASLGNVTDTHFAISKNQSPMNCSGFLPKYAQNNVLMKMPYGSVGFPACVSGVSGFRAYSSFFGDKGDGSIAKGLNADNSDGVGSDGLKNAWQSVADAASFVQQKAKVATEALTPHVQQLLDAHPDLKNAITPAFWTITGTLMAWLVMPRVLRKFHKYSMQGPAALLYNTSSEPIPYEKSFWGSLEDPVRYLVTFMAFLQLGVMIAPTTFASQYIAQAWKGGVILSFIWFIHRWKTNVFHRTLSAKNMAALDRERMLTLDKLSSVGLFGLGLMALAESSGVAVQSILTVGGIGGVATAFAARDIVGNVLSGLSLQFTRPFSVGDTIKAGSLEGKVVEMGLTTTSLLNAEKFPIIVPNSLFSSQGIVNRSRAQWRAMETKIPVSINNLEKISQISDDIKSMLKSNSKIFLGEEVPYCFLRIESTYPELVFGCNLRQMSKDELYSSKQDILLQAIQIIKEHGVLLSIPTPDLTSQ
ncbi:Mechanosensitive ion channel protein 1 protein [Thalictrum thalictroides]|uniref:Mechanosensitive ion channel protein 1 protein n=1 Tax=Thalictrum thalictroides TaxID=46969 RepID=A0A7J6VNY5_THATH|nr:Mechanosensitive ion channel protein 1 protein [Thalictrum thalictroides]